MTLVQETEVGRDEIFLLYVITESGRSLAAFSEVKRLAAVRVRRSEGVEIRENQRVFDSIRMALHYAGNVSKVFWPSRPTTYSTGRSERLKSIINLPDDHSLNDRALRNHIEHLDERLDDWTENSSRQFTGFEWVIYDDTYKEMRDQIISTVALVYEQPNDSVHILGKSFSLHEIRSSVFEVQRLVSNVLSRYHS